MAGLQNLAKSLAAAAQIDPNGDHARIHDGGDFPHRVVGVIEKDHGCPLVSRQLLERPAQLPGRIGHLIGSGAIQAHGSAPLLQHAARDPEGSSPYPGGGRADRAASSERLRKGFSHGVAGQIGILAEGPNGAIDSVALRSVKRFNRGLTLDDRGLQQLQGAFLWQNVTGRGPSPPRPDYGRGLAVCQAVGSTERILSRPGGGSPPARALTQTGPSYAAPGSRYLNPIGGGSAENPREIPVSRPVSRPR